MQNPTTGGGLLPRASGGRECRIKKRKHFKTLTLNMRVDCVLGLGGRFRYNERLCHAIVAPVLRMDTIAVFLTDKEDRISESFTNVWFDWFLFVFFVFCWSFNSSQITLFCSIKISCMVWDSRALGNEYNRACSLRRQHRTLYKYKTHGCSE
jgi:hypothetical protein